MSPVEFWAHVDKSADCWLWTAGTNGLGRGRLAFNGRTQYAYRVAWELTYGEPIPAHLEACHRCDVPLCVRPEHIFVGTHADNMRDAKVKGRLAAPAPRFGMEHHATTVPPEVIAAAVAEYRNGTERQQDVAARYGVSQTTLSRWCAAQVRPDAGLEPYKRLAPHGTHAGYARHRRAGEAACQACLEGERRHCAEQRQKRLARLSGIQADDLTAPEQVAS